MVNRATFSFPAGKNHLKLGQELVTGFKAFISSLVGLCEFEDLRKTISPTIHEHLEKQNQILFTFGLNYNF